MANFSAYPVYSGNAALGADFKNGPVIINGYLQKQAGVRSWQPNITAPGTIASAGTVNNTTGLDCNVYLTAVSGSITAIKILSSTLSTATSYSIPGTVSTSAPTLVEVPGPGAIAVTYNGTLAWTWVPA